MFGEMFQDEDEQNEIIQAEIGGAIPRYYEMRKPHAAYDMDLPPQERQPSKFVGLWNR